MGSDTTNFRFYRPSVGETGWGSAVADSFTDLDTALTQIAVNVKAPAFNATGNGSTNDTAAVLAATATLPTDGGDLLFPKGVYLVDADALAITQGAVRCRGVGWDQTNAAWGSVIKANTIGTTLLSVTGSTFQMDGMSLDGNAKATNVLTLDGLNCQIHDSHVRRPANNGAGVNIASSGVSAWLRGLRINGANQAGTIGVQVGGTDAIITDCKEVNLETSIKVLSGGGGTQVNGGHSTPGSTIGKNNIWLLGAANNLQIVGHRFDNTAGGSAVQADLTGNCNNLVISGCVSHMTTMTDDTYAFVGIDTTTACIRQITITGNTVTGQSGNRFKYGLAAQTRAGATATNTSRLASYGTIFSGNVIHASTAAFAQNPLVARGNVYTADLTTYAAVTDV